MTKIGILLDHRDYRRLRLRKISNEKVSLYHKAANRLGLKLLYMSLGGIQLRKGKAVGLLRKGKHYVSRTEKIPRVIHNRAFPKGEAERRRLRGLRRYSYVFNAQNRYAKYKIHRLIHKNPSLRKYLPHSLAFSRENLRRMIRIHDTLYIKPQRGSVGVGIIRIRRNRYGLWSIRSSKGTQTLSKIAMLRSVSHYVGHRSYMIQKGIQLATYQGRPFDIRVSVQRVDGGEWQVTGMVGKIARRGSHVTNVARGGTVKRCEPLFSHSQLPIQTTRAEVARVSLLLANYVGHKLNRLADIGLDMGVSRSGEVYFIEMNCRDQRYSFSKAGMRDTFNRTYENPLRYAAFLARKQSG